jgi:hypothetical protein
MKASRVRRVASNRVVLGAIAATLVWFADQPTVQGYNPLLQMFWDPGIAHLPLHDYLVLFLSWLVTALFCHFVLFTVQRMRHREATATNNYGTDT